MYLSQGSLPDAVFPAAGAAAPATAVAAGEALLALLNVAAADAYIPTTFTSKVHAPPPANGLWFVREANVNPPAVLGTIGTPNQQYIDWRQAEIKKLNPLAYGAYVHQRGVAFTDAQSLSRPLLMTAGVTSCVVLIVHRINSPKKPAFMAHLDKDQNVAAISERLDDLFANPPLAANEIVNIHFFGGSNVDGYANQAKVLNGGTSTRTCKEALTALYAHRYSNCFRIKTFDALRMLYGGDVTFDTRTGTVYSFAQMPNYNSFPCIPAHLDSGFRYWGNTYWRTDSSAMAVEAEAQAEPLKGELKKPRTQWDSRTDFAVVANVVQKVTFEQIFRASLNISICRLIINEAAAKLPPNSVTDQTKAAIQKSLEAFVRPEKLEVSFKQSFVLKTDENGMTIGVKYEDSIVRVVASMMKTADTGPKLFLMWIDDFNKKYDAELTQAGLYDN